MTRRSAVREDPFVKGFLLPDSHEGIIDLRASHENSPATLVPQEATRLSMNSAASLEQATTNLARLFQRVACLFSGGDSATLSTAESLRLMQSILFVLNIDHIDAPEAVAILARTDLNDEYCQRRAELDRRAHSLMNLWRQVVDTMPPIRNIALRDTLASISKFPQRYDTFFAAHEVPCDIDYQLEHPVPEYLQGIDYVEAWLDQALAEAHWLSEFEPDSCVRVLERICPDYQGLLVNLCDLLRPHESELVRRSEK